ncbi:MAG TPA: Holliday junction resolvase-like protein [Patescibacteria group bacterium]|nr:Holliday junction resolvase-like protein [Patescibacteria group bacterium]
MIDQYLIIALVVLALLAISYKLGQGGKNKLPVDQELPPNVLALYQEVHALPARVLATIQGSINPQKGKVAELLTYAELRYDYDKIIPLGSPVDFVGIKHGEKIDFIEVKSGGAILSEDEREIRRLIAAGKVNFRLINVKEQTAEAVGKLD